MLQVAVLGVGWAGTRHVEAIRELDRKLAVNCLVNNDTAFLAEKAVAQGLRKTYPDHHEALRDPEVDAVSICLPHALHARMPFDYPEASLSTYAQEMEAFADAINGVAVGPTTGRSKRRSLAIVQAGYESAESGEPVNLEARFGAL